MALSHNINAVDGPWQQPGAALELGRGPGMPLEDDGIGVLEEPPAILPGERRRRRHVEDLELFNRRRERELVRLGDVLGVHAAVQTIDRDEPRFFLEAARHAQAHAAHAVARCVRTGRFRRELGFVVDVSRARHEVLGDPDRGTRLGEHCVAVDGGRARVDESANARLAASLEQAAGGFDIDRAELRRAARGEIGHVQRGRVNDGVAAWKKRSEAARVPHVRDLPGQRAGAQVDTRHLVAERQPGGDRAADPARRPGDQDSHDSRAWKLTRRPTRQVSS